MAMPSSSTVIGVDVAKAELVIYRQDLDQLKTHANDKAGCAQLLKTLPPRCLIAIGATSTYHLLLIEMAYRQGHRVYVIDGYRLTHYRKGIGGRAKTDACDARLLARYLASEIDSLRPWNPPSKAYTSLQRLLRRRALLVKTRTALKQSVGEDPQFKSLFKPLIERIKRIELLIEKRLHDTLKAAGLLEQAQRCRGVEGIGELTAAALTMAFERGAFQSADAFIAFLGLDVRAKDSGTFTGRRKLTKQGDPEIRRLLHNAALAAARKGHWKQLYEQYQARGLRKTQALVILARKLARIAFALMKKREDYIPRTA